MTFFPKDDPASADRLRAMMGLGQVDQRIRQAIPFARMMLPDDRKSAPEVECEIRQMVDRALKDFQEDAKAFGERR